MFVVHDYLHKSFGGKLSTKKERKRIYFASPLMVEACRNTDQGVLGIAVRKGSRA